MNNYFLYFLIFMTGASLASFVCAFVDARYKNQKIFSKRRSVCENCQTELKWYSLIPIFSLLIQKGKCLNCKSKIPISLFFLEIALGLWYLFSSFYLQQDFFVWFLNLILATIFVMLTYEDISKQEVSSEYIFVLLVLVLFKSFIYLNVDDIFLAFILGLPYWLILIFSGGFAIGEADPLIISSVAIFYGAQFMLSWFFYSSWLGGILGIIFIFSNKTKLLSFTRLPFLPILFASALFIIVSNWNIIQIQDILFLYENFSKIF